jgi:hypothetical protein
VSLTCLLLNINIQTGHGKLMAAPNLGDAGFCTNVKSGAIIEVNILLRQYVRTIPLNASSLTQGFKCNGTHGIDFSPTNNMLYVECSNPRNCVQENTFGKNKTCTGSTWVVDAVQLKVVNRLVSPLLSKLYGDNYGIQGQVR